MARGQLLFKGEKPKKKKSKSKHAKTPVSASASAATEGASSSPQAAAIDADYSLSKDNGVASRSTVPPVAAAEAPKVITGKGVITTSGTVVTGYETRFQRDLAVGDALIVTIGGQQEMRVVTMLLSDMSMNLSSPFSENIASPAPFQLIRKPRNVVTDAKVAAQTAALTAKQEEEQAFGTYGSTKELVYREKTEHGSYRIKRVKVNDDGKGLTRGDLLSMRAKKKSDKYC
jgi:hypothetical protein